MKVARRVYPEVPNHRLATLITNNPEGPIMSQPCSFISPGKRPLAKRIMVVPMCQYSAGNGETSR